MQDTFTDCPLYEQTHWAGDARNEALIAFGVFGAHDLARRSHHTDPPPPPGHPAVALRAMADKPASEFIQIMKSSVVGTPFRPPFFYSLHLHQ